MNKDKNDKKLRGIWITVLMLIAVAAFLSVFIVGYFFGQQARFGRKASAPGFVYDSKKTYGQVYGPNTEE